MPDGLPTRRGYGSELITQALPYIDGALLDVNLGNEAIWPVVDTLLARNVPLVLATGYDASAIPAAYVGLPRCEKPATGQALARVLARVLATTTSS